MARTGFYHDSTDYDVLSAFYQFFLGAFAEAPTVDNNGDALRVGSLYYNTTDLAMYVWDGSVWVAQTLSADGSVTNLVTLTQAEYDAIVSPDASTLYIITA
jgi:hypothetical protein